MKHLFTLLIISLAFIAMSVTTNSEDDVCSGVVGDVKYSLLDPSKFREVNGDCWVLLDGRSLASGTTLRDMGFSQIPDAQGVFIRSMELRSTGRRDVDRAFGVPVGDYQVDEFKIHRHNSVQYADGRFATNGGGTGTNAWGWALHGLNTTAKINITGGAGGNETRPKNIALYTYVRVD